MIREINLDNYKCFKNSGNIEIKPLTILCGINSSGKSTVIKSLLTLKQTYENAGEKYGLVLNSEYVKNGSFSDIAYMHCEEEVSVTNEFKINRPLQPDNRGKIEITAFKNIAKMYPDYDKILHIVIRLKSTFKPVESDNILIRQNYEINVVYEDGKTIASSVDFKKQKSNWNIVIHNFPNKNDELISEMKLMQVACYFENFRVVNLYVKRTIPPTYEVVYIVNNICTLSRYTGNLYQNINYLTPLRVYPQRTYLSDEEITNVGLGGENTAQFLSYFQNRSIKMSGFCPPGASVSKPTLGNYVNKWMEYLGIGTYNVANSSEIVRLNINGNNVINVGFGVSQTLPILVSGLTMRVADTLLLEQPEIHLHPKAQMAIGDFLVSLANCGKGAVVETHSDHIINRIVKRIMDGSIDKENVAIYFIENTDNCSTISKVQVDMVKGVVDAPEEFFTQFASELSEMFKIGMDNLKKTRN